MSPRFLLAPLTVAVLLLLGSTPARANEATDLRAQVHRALVGSTARTVAVAVDVDGLGGIVRDNPDLNLPPASTQKLFTMTAALKLLGSSYQERTQLRSTGTKSGALLSGDLYLVAGGDPLLTSAQLDSLAKAFATRGITTIQGHLVMDDTRYDRIRHAPGWKAEWVPEESGPLSAMAVDGNEWRHDAAYLADPATPVLSKMRAYLANRGIHFTTSDARLGRAPGTAATWASYASAPLSTVATHVLKDSDNFAAELIMKELGKVARGAGTTADGAKVVRAQTGPGGGISDWSGLSSYDRSSVLRELVLLRGGYQLLEPKLPVGCKDGTLEHRFCGTVAAGRVWAKTGTLDTVHALAGWTRTRDGHLVTFCFLLSGFSSGTKATAAIDRAVVALAGATVG